MIFGAQFQFSAPIIGHQATLFGLLHAVACVRLLLVIAPEAVRI